MKEAMMIPVISQPPETDWPALCVRPESAAEGDVNAAVQDIMERVRSRGDAALRDYTEMLDGVRMDDLRPTQREWQMADELDAGLARAIDVAAVNIRTFHAAQKKPELSVETSIGVRCWRRSVPIRRVGLYVPGGTAPLFSTLLMLGIPAVVAGCPEIVVVTPPGPDGTVHPAILYAARTVGVQQVRKVGGAQAIAALAFGTESVPAVDKIFGPGNRYVTAAKMFAQSRGVAIDLPAGPSEVLVIADESCDPAFVAADLLAQAEHGPDSQVVLVTTDEGICIRVARELQLQLDRLPRKIIASEALSKSRMIVLSSLAEALAFSNLYAPEHLILAVDEPERLAAGVINAGSVFLGHYTPESLGDYASGTNHTLPTNGWARSYSGVSLDSFVREITFQEAGPEGLRSLGPVAERMAYAESLDAHAIAVSLRLAALNESVGADRELGGGDDEGA